MSRMLRTSKLYTDNMNDADANSIDLNLPDALTRNNSALAVLNGTMPVYGSAGNASMDSAASGGAAGAGPAAPSPALSGGSTQNTVGTPGRGLAFNNTFDNTCSLSFINCVVAAENELKTLFTNSLTVSVSFTEATTAATPSNPNPNALGNSWAGVGNVLVSYAQLQNALPTGDSLPASDPNSAGGSDWYLPAAYARMLGLSSVTPASGKFDDTVTLNTFYNWTFGQDVINGVIHEMTEGIMGRVGSLSKQTGAAWSTMDLFRYSVAGVHDYSDGSDGKTTYFSSDGVNLSAASNLSFNNQYNSTGTQTNTGDTSDWTQQAVFGAAGTGETLTLTQTELNVLAALGWKEALPQQEVFAASSADWQTPTAWSDGFMPITTQDALIGSGSPSIATSTSNVTVNSIGTNTSGTLIIGGNSVFTATNGTVVDPASSYVLRSGNLGAIDVDVGSLLLIGNTFDNAGSLTLGTNNNSGFGVLAIGGTVTLNGGGKISLGQKSSGSSSSYTTGVIDSADVLVDNSKLINVDNTIAGGGLIDVPSFDNQSKGVVDANQQSGNALRIIANTFKNEGTMKAEGLSTLDFGWDSGTELLSNTGTVAVYGQGDLAVRGNFTVSGSGAIQFQGAGAEITSDGAASTTFTNASAINAYYTGQIGDVGTGHANDLTFVNTGTVTVSGSGQTLTLNTSGNMINNYSGTLEAINGGNLVIDSNVNTGQFPTYVLPYPPGGTIEAGNGGTVTLAATVANFLGGVQSGQIVIDGGKFIMLAGSTVDNAVPINFTSNGGTLELHNTSSLVGASGNNGTIDLNSAQVAITGGNDFVDFVSGSNNVANLWNTGSSSDSVLVNGYYGTVNLHSANAAIIGGIQTVNFASGSGNVASLWSTGPYTDNVYGSNGTVSLIYASASIVGGNDTVNFSSSSGNVANLWNTGSASDTVNGSNGTVNLMNAMASVVGGNDTISFVTSGDSVSLYNTGGNSDTVNGSNGTVNLNSANAAIVGGNDTVNFSSGSGNVASLSNTGSGRDTVNGSNGTVNLNNASATIVGGNDIVNISSGYGNVANLSNTGSNSDTINFNGYYGEIDLNSAGATIVGGIQTVNFAGGSGNVANLSNTGPYTDNVHGSNGTISLSNAKAAIVGGNDTVEFSSGSNVANLWNTGSARDTVNGSNGTLNMYNAMATVAGGNDTINFGTSHDEASLSNTGGNWDTVNGSNGKVDLSNAQAVVNGTGDTVAFLGTAGSTVSAAGASENFVFQPLFGQDTLAGFGATDSISLSASDFGGNWAGLQSHMAQSGSNTVITLDANNSITLAGVAASSLQSSQFHFA